MLTVGYSTSSIEGALPPVLMTGESAQVALFLKIFPATSEQVPII
jgi:hypothetical protein